MVWLPSTSDLISHYSILRGLWSFLGCVQYPSAPGLLRCCSLCLAPGPLPCCSLCLASEAGWIYDVRISAHITFSERPSRSISSTIAPVPSPPTLLYFPFGHSRVPDVGLVGFSQSPLPAHGSQDGSAALPREWTSSSSRGTACRLLFFWEHFLENKITPYLGILFIVYKILPVLGWIP